MKATKYGYSVKTNLSFDQAVIKATEELKRDGFGILTEIDVKGTMKKKLDLEFRRYVILGACNPSLAHRALSADLTVGLMLPCNVVVYENTDGTCTVSALNPMAAIGVVGNPSLDETAALATAKLSAVIAKLTRLSAMPA